MPPRPTPRSDPPAILLASFAGGEEADAMDPRTAWLMEVVCSGSGLSGIAVTLAGSRKAIAPEWMWEKGLKVCELEVSEVKVGHCRCKANHRIERTQAAHANEVRRGMR